MTRNGCRIANSKHFIFFHAYVFIRAIFLLMTFFENFYYKARYLLKLCQFLAVEFRVFDKIYENDVRVIFDQWPKLNLVFNVEPEIRI